jgi:hypothetical protein
MLSQWRYMPILKWKRGERDALRYLTAAQWDGVMPLIELLAIGAAPDSASLKAAIPGYTDEVANQLLKSVPADQPVAIDTAYISTGFPRQVHLLLVICKTLQKKVPNSIIPVIRASWLDALPGLPSTHVDAMKSLNEIVLRLQTDELGSLQVAPSVDALAKLVKRKQIHLVLDQFSLVDRVPAVCMPALTPYLAVAWPAGCASVTLAGGSFPINLTGKKQGVTDLPRVEWQIWKKVTTGNPYPGLRYADYTVSNPAPQEEDIDPKKVNPSIAIRYANDTFWRLYKGRGFKKGPSGELRSLCQLLESDPNYGGEKFCYGDKQYKKYANNGPKNGIPWTWRRDATNRHIALTISSL